MVQGLPCETVLSSLVFTLQSQTGVLFQTHCHISLTLFLFCQEMSCLQQHSMFLCLSISGRDEVASTSQLQQSASPSLQPGRISREREFTSKSLAVVQICYLQPEIATTFEKTFSLTFRLQVFWKVAQHHSLNSTAAGHNGSSEESHFLPR